MKHTLVSTLLEEPIDFEVNSNDMFDCKGSIVTFQNVPDKYVVG